MQLYKEDTTTVLQDNKGIIVAYSKIKYSQRFVMSKAGDVLSGKTLQSLINFLQKVNPALMICPLDPTYETSSNYIDQTFHIPITEKSLLCNYFTNTVLQNSVHRVFLIWTKHSLTTLKEKRLCHGFSKNKENIAISNKLANREKERHFFIYRANEAITRQDNLKIAIHENMDIP